MSLKKSLLLGCSLVIFGLGLGGVFYYFTDHQSRTPASALPAPLVKKGNWSHDVVTPVGKPQRMMDVSITPVNGVPSSNDQELILRATVSLYQSLGNEIEYHWVLPMDATLVDGNLTDVWQNLQAGQSVSVDIALLNVSRAEPKTIVFQAFGMRDGVRLGGSAAFSTASAKPKSEEGETASQKLQSQEKAKRQADAFRNVQQ